jgi:hypothetical protein
LSALFFGDESKKLITNVFFVLKESDKIESALDQLLLSLPPKIEFIGCDDPAGANVKKFTSLKLNLSLLKTISAQKLSTRMTTVKNNDILSVPSDGVNIKVNFNMPQSIQQIKEESFVSDDGVLTIEPSQKGSSLKSLLKNWKKVRFF